MYDYIKPNVNQTFIIIFKTIYLIDIFFQLFPEKYAKEAGNITTKVASEEKSPGNKESSASTSEKKDIRNLSEYNKI